MARPERHDVDYFPFYVKRGKTLNILQAKYGLEGIGFFTQLCRFLSTTPDHHYQILNSIDRMNFFAEIGMRDESVGMEILDLLATTGKIDKMLWSEKKAICSQDFLKSLSDAYDRRTNSIITIEAIRAHYGLEIVKTNENNDSNTHTTELLSENNDNNPQTKLNENKLNKTKVSIYENQGTYPKQKQTRKKRLCEDYSQDFLFFWDQYPKHEGKKIAYKTFNALVNAGIDCNIIHERLKIYKSRIQALNTGYEYIRHPSTFLNNLEDYADGFVPKPKPQNNQNRPVQSFDFQNGIEIRPKNSLGDFHGNNTPLDGL